MQDNQAEMVKDGVTQGVWKKILKMMITVPSSKFLEFGACLQDHLSSLQKDSLSDDISVRH